MELRMTKVEQRFDWPKILTGDFQTRINDVIMASNVMSVPSPNKRLTYEKCFVHLLVDQKLKPNFKVLKWPSMKS